ncbi:hypothetical protein ACWA5Z_10050 [Testudinibacter sp. P80/BLE/0925]|uniref:hypothetical protein n=1 Tax=Testudinibacter sp. TW-1 TaxID=3417757 RepID=UPI003D36BE07
MKQGIYINGKKVIEINENTVIQQVFSGHPDSVQVAGGQVKNMIAGNMTILGDGAVLAAPNAYLIVDGQVITLDQGPTIQIEVVGNVARIESVTAAVTVNGNVGRADTTSGDIHVTGDIAGDAKSVSGNIDCDTLHGDANTVSGNIKIR